MADPVKAQSPFDERAALEELERLRNQIERYRAERKAVEEEFDRFTASFNNPAPAPVPVPAVTPAAFDAGTAGQQSAPGETAEPVEVETPASPTPVIKTLPVSRPPHRALPLTPLVIAGAVIVLAGAAYIVRTQTRPGIQPPAAAAKPSDTPPAGQAGVPPAAPAAPPRHESVLTTTRTVWVRVIADGAPVVERQFPPNTRLPFVAKEKIVIRAGDAGAVRLSIDGVDQGLLGQTGEVLTRRFDVPR